MQLRQATARSAMWLILRFAGRQGANTAVFFILAALINPRDFGLASIAVAFALILRAAVQRGFRDVVVQREELAPETLNTAWWLNAGFGLILSTTLVVSAPLIALAFDEPALEPLAMMAALIPFITGLSAVQEARLERDFRHKVLTAAQVAASLTAAGVGIGAAFYGLGPWALVIYNISEVTCVALVTLLIARWVPGLMMSREEARRQIAFALPITLSAVVNMGNLRFAQILVGAVISPQATAFFRIGTQVNQSLTQLFTAPLVQVLLPAFSRARTGLDRHHVRALAALGAVNFPVFLGAAAVAPGLLVLVLGETWRPGAETVSILCFAVVAASVQRVTTQALIAQGLSRTAAFVAVLNVFVILCFTAAGAFVSLKGAASGLVLAGFVTLVVNTVVTQREIGAPVRRQLAAVAAYFVPAVAMYLAVQAILFEAEAWTVGAIWALGVAIPAGGVIYVVLVRFGVKALAPRYYEPLLAAAPRRVKRFL